MVVPMNHVGEETMAIEYLIGQLMTLEVVKKVGGAAAVHIFSQVATDVVEV